MSASHEMEAFAMSLYLAGAGSIMAPAATTGLAANEEAQSAVDEIGFVADDDAGDADNGNDEDESVNYDEPESGDDGDNDDNKDDEDDDEDIDATDSLALSVMEVTLAQDVNDPRSGGEGREWSGRRSRWRTRQAGISSSLLSCC